MFKNTTTMLVVTILALVTWASGMPARAATVPTGFIAAADPMDEGKGGRYLTQNWHPGAVETAIRLREPFRTFETELLVCCRIIDPRVRTVGPGAERLACPTGKR